MSTAVIAIILLGWPSAVVGTALLLAGVVSHKVWLTALGALAATGFCAYIASYPPPGRWLGLTALAANWLVVLAVWRRAVTWAGAAMLPILLTVSVVGYVVLMD